MESSVETLHSCLTGWQQAAAELVPLVYNELRRLAVRRLRHERPDHTFDSNCIDGAPMA